MCRTFDAQAPCLGFDSNVIGGTSIVTLHRVGCTVFLSGQQWDVAHAAVWHRIFSNIARLAVWFVFALLNITQ